MKNKLFIGVTSWNSQFLLGTCLDSIRKTEPLQDYSLYVIDNNSTDNSAKIANSYGATVISKSSTQAEAINYLLGKSQSDYTLLIHSDVVLLNKRWFEICVSMLQNDIILLSPEDIGCGPLTRPFGKGKPESSFLFFRTKKLKECRQWKLCRRRYKISFRRELDLSASHLTHNLPYHLEQRHFKWYPMNVYVSPYEDHPLYQPISAPPIWSDELSYLRYGLGNFYGVNNTITHYHNWYDRVMGTDLNNSNAAKRAREFPHDFIKEYTNRFLSDYYNNSITFPKDLNSVRQPKAL